jgi:hypothetical protein
MGLLEQNVRAAFVCDEIVLYPSAPKGSERGRLRKSNVEGRIKKCRMEIFFKSSF